MLRQAPSSQVSPQVQEYHRLVNELRVAQQDAIRAGDKPPGCAVVRSSGERETDWTVSGFTSDKAGNTNVILRKPDPQNPGKILRKDHTLSEFAKWQTQLCLEAKTHALAQRREDAPGIQGTIEHTIRDLGGEPKYLIPIAEAYLQNTSQGGESHILPQPKEPVLSEDELAFGRMISGESNDSLPEFMRRIKEK